MEDLQPCCVARNRLWTGCTSQFGMACSLLRTWWVLVLVWGEVLELGCVSKLLSWEPTEVLLLG